MWYNDVKLKVTFSQTAFNTESSMQVAVQKITFTWRKAPATTDPIRSDPKTEQKAKMTVTGSTPLWDAAFH